MITVWKARHLPSINRFQHKINRPQRRARPEETVCQAGKWQGEAVDEEPATQVLAQEQIIKTTVYSKQVNRQTIWFLQSQESWWTHMNLEARQSLKNQWQATCQCHRTWYTGLEAPLATTNEFNLWSLTLLCRDTSTARWCYQRYRKKVRNKPKRRAEVRKAQAGVLFAQQASVE